MMVKLNDETCVIAFEAESSIFLFYKKINSDIQQKWFRTKLATVF